MGVKINLRIITKNHAADSEIGFLTKSIRKPYSRHAAMPTAWELMNAHFIEENLPESRDKNQFSSFP